MDAAIGPAAQDSKPAIVCTTGSAHYRNMGLLEFGDSAETGRAEAGRKCCTIGFDNF
jgi:hypothetical protein